MNRTSKINLEKWLGKTRNPYSKFYYKGSQSKEYYAGIDNENSDIDTNTDVFCLFKQLIDSSIENYLMLELPEYDSKTNTCNIISIPLFTKTMKESFYTFCLNNTHNQYVGINLHLLNELEEDDELEEDYELEEEEEEELEEEEEEELEEEECIRTRHDYRIQLTEQSDRIDDYIRLLWTTVIMPYLSNMDTQYILNNLESYCVFYKYMLDNSPAIKCLLEKFDTIDSIKFPSVEKYLTPDQKTFYKMQRDNIQMIKSLKKQISCISP